MMVGRYHYEWVSLQSCVILDKYCTTITVCWFLHQENWAAKVTNLADVTVAGMLLQIFE